MSVGWQCQMSVGWQCQIVTGTFVSGRRAMRAALLLLLSLSCMVISRPSKVLRWNIFVTRETRTKLYSWALGNISRYSSASFTRRWADHGMTELRDRCQNCAHLNFLWCSQNLNCFRCLFLYCTVCRSVSCSLYLHSNIIFVCETMAW